MKLISYKHAGRETWGALSGDRVLDLAAASGRATLADFIASPSFQERDALAAVAKPGPLFTEVELLPVIASALTTDGETILSGILIDERDAMLAELGAGGWRLIDEDEEGMWWSARITRP